MDNPLVLLLVLALVAGALLAFLRSRSAPAQKRPNSGPPLDDLRSLGLSEVRTRSATAPAQPDAVVETSEAVDMDLPEELEAEAAEVPAEPRATPPQEPDTRRAASSVEEDVRARPSSPRSSIAGVAPLLDSLRASLGARSVALLRHDESADGYEVVGRAGEGFGGKFNFPAPGNALHRVTADGTISILEGTTFGALAYHIRPESTVGHAVALAVNAPVRHLLVADRGPDDAAFGTPQLDLLGEFADLVGRLLGSTTDRPAPSAPSPLPATVDPGKRKKQRADDATMADLFSPPADSEAAEPTDEAPRPRRVILAEEIDSAREAGRPLAFALVTRRGAEEAENADTDAIESDLRVQLEAVDGTERVERFGDALMGVFGYFDAAEAEEWAERVAHAGESVHIGIAMLADRHDAEDLRGDAAAALHDAYERDETCVILSDE